MATLTITLKEDQLDRLQKVAAELGVSPEAVVQNTLDEYLTRRARFQQAADYVLEKNAELYRRLAQ
ncbi:MAG: DNA-binding protein [Planctomycetia bacterium]|nr:DNA-binding protein [Planctomycetia bacterium]